MASFLILLVSSAYAISVQLENGQKGAKYWIEGEFEDRLHELIFAVPQNNLSEIESLLRQVSEPKSPLYGRYLTFDQVGKMVQNEEATEKVQTWLSEEGITCQGTPYGEYLKCKTSTATWNRVLNASFRKYVSGNTTVVRSPHYSIPKHIAPYLSTVLQVMHLPQLRVDVPARKSTSQTDGKTTPALLNQYYNISDNSCGHRGSQSVFESGTNNMSPNDLKSFQKLYKIPPNPVGINIGGNNDSKTCEYLPFECGEANLDVQV